MTYAWLSNNNSSLKVLYKSSFSLATGLNPMISSFEMKEIPYKVVERSTLTSFRGILIFSQTS